MRSAPALHELLDLILPPGCIACGSWMPRASGRGTAAGLLCGPCRTRLTAAPWPRCPRCDHPLGTGRTPAPVCRECESWPSLLERSRSAWVLAPPADTLVHALKYEGWPELAVEMGRDMARLAIPGIRGRGGVAVVPVPTTARRVAQRGYNQAELLARSFAAEVGGTLVDALTRRHGGSTQVALHPSERRANVKGSFVPRSARARCLEGAHTVLVDDVLTTGATAAAAVEALDELGVSGVTLVTFARALPFRRPGGP